MRCSAVGTVRGCMADALYCQRPLQRDFAAAAACPLPCLQLPLPAS